VILLAGLILAIPLVAITSSLKLGDAAARNGLFLVPSETAVLPILADAHYLKVARAAEPDGIYHRLVLDDRAVHRLHLQLLQEAPPTLDVPPERLAALTLAARQRQTESFTRQDWIALLSDAKSLADSRPDNSKKSAA
jgi:membrane glycosyltransferase